MTSRRARRAKRKTMKGGESRYHAARANQTHSLALACYRRLSGQRNPPTYPTRLESGYMSRCGLPVETVNPALHEPSELIKAKRAWEDAGSPGLIPTNMSGLGGIEPDTYYRAIAAAYLNSVGAVPNIRRNVVRQGQNVYNAIKEGRLRVNNMGKLLPPPRH